MRRCKSGGEAGFTLVETLIALALLAGAIVTLAYLIVLAVANTERASQATIAIVLAVQKMEQLRSLGFDTIDTGSDNVDESGHVSDLEGRTGGERLFDRQWTVSRFGSDPTVLVLEVLVIPAGTRRTVPNAQHRARLVTLRVREGPDR